MFLNRPIKVWSLLLGMVVSSQVRANIGDDLNTFKEKFENNVPVAGAIVKAADKTVQTVTNATVTVLKAGAESVVQIVQGGGQVLVGLGEVLAGKKEGWNDVSAGFKKSGNGVLYFFTTATLTIISTADPLIGTLFFDNPSPLQGIAKFLYDRISASKGLPTCSPQKELDRLMTVPKNTLGDVSRLLGRFSTPAKYLQSITGGYGAWTPTGCDAIGYGKPIRDAQHSTDGFWTADLKLLSFSAGGLNAQLGAGNPDRYIRLEIVPGTAAHDSATQRLLRPTDVIKFSGPMIWDGDHDSDHPSGHMEVHPFGTLEFGAAVPPPLPVGAPAPQVQPGLPQPPPVAPGPTKLTIRKGDNLSKLAEQFYGVQRWPGLYCPNRKLIKLPDLIYPGQEFEVPNPDDLVKASRCIRRRR